MPFRPIRALWVAALLLIGAAAIAPEVSAAEVVGTAGQYRVVIHTDPAVVPTGRATLFARVSSTDGKPVEGARVRVLVKMPDMDMGEKETAATSAGAEPGVYSAPVSFAMEGAYVARVAVDGPAGPATATLDLRTGQDTSPSPRGAGGGFSWPLLLWAGAGLLGLFILFRMWRTGQFAGWRSLLRPEALIGIILIVGTVFLSRWAVDTFRRPNSMSLVDALASDMSNMPAPPGQGPVALATVERAPVQATIRYSGSAVGFVEQDVYPRITGWITWMPFYAGDRVRSGQLLAKLDTREYESRTEERRANQRMAEQMTGIARLEYQQGLAAAAQARAEVRSKQGALEEVRRMHLKSQGMLKESQAGLTEARNELRAMQAEATAAREEQSETQEMLQSARAMEPEAEAMLSAMKADQSYWTKQLARMKALLDAGAVSGEEFQRDEAMAKGADAKVRQAEAKLQAVRSDIRAANSRVSRTQAMLESAGAKVAQAQSRVQGMEARIEQAQAEVAALAGRIEMAEGDLEAARANVRAMQAMADAGSGKIRQAQAGVQGAQAALTTANVVQGYTEIRSLVDGVVTQRLISPGVLVNPGQAILKVAQVDPIRLQANVAETDLASVRIGSPITVRGQDGKVLASARVSSITPTVDPTTRTGIVEAVLPNKQRRFRPGQYVRMELGTRAQENGLRVPTSAIRWQSVRSSNILSTDRTAFVWVAEAAGDDKSFTVSRKEVRIGAGDGQFTEVLAGLQEGQQVIARGGDYLRPGDTVTAVTWTGDGPEALPKSGTQPGLGGHSGHGGKPSAPAGEGHSGHGGQSSE